jgi:hypothetical protein
VFLLSWLVGSGADLGVDVLHVVLGPRHDKCGLPAISRFAGRWRRGVYLDLSIGQRFGQRVRQGARPPCHATTDHDGPTPGRGGEPFPTTTTVEGALNA